MELNIQLVKKIKKIKRGAEIMFSHELEYLFNKEYREWWGSLFENVFNEKKEVEIDESNNN